MTTSPAARPRRSIDHPLPARPPCCAIGGGGGPPGGWGARRVPRPVTFVVGLCRGRQSDSKARELAHIMVADSRPQSSSPTRAAPRVSLACARGQRKPDVYTLFCAIGTQDVSHLHPPNVA